MQKHPKHRRGGAMPPESPAPDEQLKDRQDKLQLQILFAADAETATAILASCEAVLETIARVTASQLYPYPHIPGHYQAILDLQPQRGAPQALEIVLSLGGGWRRYGAGAGSRAIWQCTGESGFLHPEVRWACVSRTTLPRRGP